VEKEILNSKFQIPDWSQSLGKLRVKHLLIGLAAFVFATAVLITSVIDTTAQSSSSYQVLPAETTAEPSPEATVSPEPKVDYYLPYPGILPDSFLYPLKMVRDRILLILTFDPVQKAERLLLFADKRLKAGEALIEGGKEELGLETLSKGEKYLEQAIVQAERAKTAGKETTALYEKLAQASLKHQEVLGNLILKVPSETQTIFQELMKYPQQGYEKVMGVLGGE
jgi:hypothetical protein